MPSYAAQCRELKHTEPFKKLGTCKAQALLAKLNEAWQSFYTLLRLKKKGKLSLHIRKIRPPRYWKRNGKRVPYQCGELWVDKQGRLEVLYDELSGKWYAHISVEVE